MNVILHAEPSIDHSSEQAPTREPIWRVVGASVATGLIGALILTLGVFGGAAEHVITGSALLAFAAGWAMLDLLSRRFTSQPQRWARVPAAAMAVAGFALIIVRPGDHTLNAAGWLWPPGAIALAVWIFRRLRRDLRGRVRWLLYPVVAAIAIGSGGAMYETAGTVSDHATYRPPGTLYDVGGHRLHLWCTGTGSPTVVLQNGLGETSAHWTLISSAIAHTTRVCSYDRAGQGWSDDVGAPQDGVDIAADLHTLLARAGEHGPFVLVGHSAGGPYAMTFAAQYPGDVAGMVLLDSMSPDAFTSLPGFTAEQSMMRRGLGVLPSLARMGIARILPSSVWSSFPEPAASQVQAFASSPRNMRSMRDEQSMYPTVLPQAKRLTSLGGKPLVVVIASESVAQHKQWIELQDRLVALSTNSEHRIVQSTHAGVVTDPKTYQASVAAIVDVITSVRTGAGVAA